MIDFFVAWVQDLPRSEISQITHEEGFYGSSNNANQEHSDVTYLPANSLGQTNYRRLIGLGLGAVRKE